MPDTPEKPDPLDLSASDIRALRYFGMAWGATIAAAWLILDDDRTRLIVTLFDLGILAVTLLAIYLLRRWKKRR
jgi:hypothetical protein